MAGVVSEAHRGALPREKTGLPLQQIVRETSSTTSTSHRTVALSRCAARVASYGDVMFAKLCNARCSLIFFHMNRAFGESVDRSTAAGTKLTS